MWLSKRATLTEIESHWSYLDLVRANEVLDIEDDLAEMARQEAK